ncbi:MAG: ATP-grasp domain-containing protein [Nanoarchaeota archaeon]
MDSVFVDARVKFHRSLPFAKKRRNETFAIMSQLAEKCDLNLFISRHDFYNKRTRCLKKAWEYKDNRWQITKKNKVGLCYYHGLTKNINLEVRKISKRINLPILNNLELERICDDKFLTHNIFPDLVPKTFLVNDHFEMHRLLHFIKTEKIVLKPRDGSFGRNVLVIRKRDLTNGIKRNTIIQEFIDSRNFFDIKRPKDMRLVIINGKVDHAYLRIARPGSYVANMIVGAKKIYLSRDSIPSSVIRRAKVVDKLFEHYGPRVYTTDFIIDQSNKPWLVELNSKPGMLFYDGAEKIRNKYFYNLFNILKSLL